MPLGNVRKKLVRASRFLSHFSITQLKNQFKPSYCQEDDAQRERERYRIGCGIGIEKSGLSEIAEVERFVVLENVEIVVILVFKN